MDISEGVMDDTLQSLDSDSNLVTASDGYTSACSPLSSNSQTQNEIFLSQPKSVERTNGKEVVQESSQDDGNGSSEERDNFGKRGDADGCSVNNSDEALTKGLEREEPDNEDLSTIEASLDNLSISQETNSDLKVEEASPKSECHCKRSDTHTFEETGTALQGAWTELRTSIRQLYRTVVPSQNKTSINISRSRPSVNRIRALSNMLFNHDPHQLFTRACQLSQEFCIELKVKLLSSIHDSPDIDEASAFIQGLCESYQCIMSACEAVQAAFEKLDSEHLSMFGLNWMTVNMHTFNTAVFTDLDVQDYINLCTQKAGESNLGDEAVGCLASLKRTLVVAENIWTRAEAHLQDYVMERAAINAQRRQLLTDWGHNKANHHAIGKFAMQKQLTGSHHNLKEPGSNVSSYNDRSLQQCSCSECQVDSIHKDNPSNVNKELPLKRNDSPSGCECHFCNLTISQLQTGNVLTPSSGEVLPPLTQPQLSLYPHIHGTAAVSDIVPPSPGVEDAGPITNTTASKPPMFSNPYLGSDLLTEQLIREWDSAYGDALSLPGSGSLTSINNINSHNTLPNNLENLGISSRPSYAHHMVDHSFPFVPEAASSTTGHAHTSLTPVNDVQTQSSCSLPGGQNGPSTPCSASGSSETLSGVDSRLHSVPAHDHSACAAAAAATLPQRNGESVITHTKTYLPSMNILKDIPREQGDALRSDDNSPSRETPSDSETSGHDEWSSGDETDASDSSSSLHQDSHCDCCYCHMLQSKTGGGRQKYSDRRERLLKILSRKKKANNSSSSSSNTSTTATTNKPVISCKKLLENQSGQQTLDEILNFIEGRRNNEPSRVKKAAKKARQKEKKLALMNQEGDRKSEVDLKEMQNGIDDYEDDEDLPDEYEEEEEEEEEEDGPLAELRRRAPDVTITVVKPGQKQASQPSRVPQMSITRDSNSSYQEGSKHPLVSKPILQPNAPRNDSWNPPRGFMSSGNMPPFGGFPSTGGRPMPDKGYSKDKLSSAQPAGLSNLLKDMEANKDQDPNAKSSQMVTIRRVMDPVSAEPTVTITLKGEEPDKDKVLFKLVNGQGQSGKKEAPKKVKQKGPPQEKPVYNIPEGVSPEEAKKIQKMQKKERQRQRKEQERLDEQKQEQMQQLQLKKQQEFLRQQEKQIRQQQLALQRQQEELLKRKQTQNDQQGKNKKGKKGKKGNEKVKEPTKKNGTASYNDDVSRNFNLPPGVSISKVAGQPGMVTISNNMGSNFAQPFLPNPSLFQNSMMSGYPSGASGFPVGAQPSMGYPGMYGGGCSNMPWNSSIDPCTGSPEESVIVVDTKAGAMCCNNNTKKSKKTKNQPVLPVPKKEKAPAKPITKMMSKKAFEKLTSEEKVEAAVHGKVDTTLLNQTQKKKYKKALKAIREEKDKVLAIQREEDNLMDEMYRISKGDYSQYKSSKQNTSKSNKNNTQSGKIKENKKQNQVVETNRENKNRKEFQHRESNGNVKVNVNTKSKTPIQKTQQTQKQALSKHAQTKQQTTQKVQTKAPPKQPVSASQSSHQKGAKNITPKQNSGSTKQKHDSSIKTQHNTQHSQQRQSTVSKQQTQRQVITQPKQKTHKQQNPQTAQQVLKQQPLPQKQHPSKQSQQNTRQLTQNKQTLTQSKQPVTQNKHPLTHNKQPLTNNKQPLTHNKQPLTHSKQTLTDSKQPLSHKKQQSTHNKLPLNLNKQPMPHNKQPLTHNKQQTQTKQAIVKGNQSKQNIQPQANSKQKGGKQSNLLANNPQNKYRSLLQQKQQQASYSDRSIGSNFSKTLGYSNDIGHEARYAQYLVANASTLAAVESSYKANAQYSAHDDRKGKKKGKRGAVEDLNTIDSVFAPKDTTAGELDETDREVEAFKRFCLQNVPRKTGEKPKVNFNVKDILIKKRQGM